MILSSIPYGTLKLDRILEERVQNEFNAEKNSKKSDAELAWDFVLAESSRKALEPQEILSRMATGYEDPRLGCRAN